MRKLVLKMSMTVDGFVCGPNGEIDWIFRGSDAGSREWMVGFIGQAGLHIMGSRTFHDMASFWPTSTQPFAAPMNEIPKAVFTRKGLVRSGAAQTTQAIQDATRDRESRGEAVLSAPAAAAASWDAAYEARGDIAEEVARLKAQPGRFIMAHGGVGFARSLAERSLVDEYWLAIHPVAIGRGQSLFASLPKALPLALVSSTVFSSGVNVVCYRPEG